MSMRLNYRTTKGDEMGSEGDELPNNTRGVNCHKLKDANKNNSSTLVKPV